MRPILVSRWSIMSVNTHTSESEVALREAPSIAEHQAALGGQIRALRRRLREFIEAGEQQQEVAGSRPEQIHRE